MMHREVELLAVGAGPSNLALAVALEELAPDDLAANSLVLERGPAIEWQSGLLLPWATTQASFLKDVATLRDPCSKFTFLNYLYSVGRLDDFINLGSFTVYRTEFSDYLGWVADNLSKVQVSLNSGCASLEARRDAGGTVTGWLARLEDGSEISSRYLVIGIGRDPYVPPMFDGLSPHRLIHSTQYRPRLAGLTKEFPYRVAVIGSAQSAAEMFRALQSDLPNADITWVMRSITLMVADKAKFANELFFPSFVDEFYQALPAAQDQIMREMHRTNYSAIEPGLLESLYGEFYLDRLTKQNRKHIVTMADITGAEETADDVVLEVTDRKTGEVTELREDLLVLGTGFCREMPVLVQGLAASLGLQEKEIRSGRTYRLIHDGPSEAACYLQGVNETTHGIPDSLLSLVCPRAGEIVEDILAHRGGKAGAVAGKARADAAAHETEGTEVPVVVSGQAGAGVPGGGARR
jgi:L-ornithine N5-monooxygenase